MVSCRCAEGPKYRESHGNKHSLNQPLLDPIYHFLYNTRGFSIFLHQWHESLTSSILMRVCEPNMMGLYTQFSCSLENLMGFLGSLWVDRMGFFVKWWAEVSKSRPRIISEYPKFTETLGVLKLTLRKPLLLYMKYCNSRNLSAHIFFTKWGSNVLRVLR